MPTSAPDPRDDPALTLLRAFVARYPTQRAAAAALGMTPSGLCDVLKRRNPVSPALASRLADLARRLD